MSLIADLNELSGDEHRPGHLAYNESHRLSEFLVGLFVFAKGIPEVQHHFDATVRENEIAFSLRLPVAFEGPKAFDELRKRELWFDLAIVHARDNSGETGFSPD